MRLRLMKTNLLKRIYSILLVLCLFLSVFSSGIVVKAGDGSGTGNGDNDGIHGDGDSSFDTGITVYRVSFHIEKYPLEDNLLKEGVESGKFVGDDSAGLFKYDTFWYRCELLNAQNYEEGTQLSLAAGESNFSHIINKNIESNQCFYIVDDSNGFKVNDNNMSGSAAKNFCNRENFGSMKVALNSSGAWHSLGKNDYKVAKFSDFKGKSIFGNISSMDDLLNVFNTDINVGFNAFNRPEDKLSAYETVCGIGGLDTSLLADFENKGIVIVEKCFAVSRKENGYRNWQVVSWGSLLANNVATFGEGSHSNLIGMSDSSYIKSAKPGNTMPKNINKVGKFYLFQYSPLIKEGNLKPNKGAAEAYQNCSGFGIWGFTAAGGAGTATNTLAVYNADPVTGGTADPTKWEIYSTIVDGKMPDTPDGTCEDLKFWNKTDWKSASKFLEAIDGNTSDTLQNIDNGEYAMIARDSYRNVAVPAYKNVLMSGVVANNDKAQESTKLLEKAPENVVWGAKTVSELTGNADSFGNVITIATLNGMPFGNNTSGYAQTANGLQMVGGVRKAGTLTNDPILEQVNNEIKNAFTQSSSGNWTGTGVGTHFTTDTSALGSAVEIVVKGKPVESDLHVVSVFDGVATLTPNVKNYKYTTVNYGIVDPQLDSGVSDTVQAVILVPKDGTPTGDSITSSMQGTTPDNAISTFIGLSEDSREGAPIINVGNKDDKGYDIYVLIFAAPPEPVEGAVELPDYLLNLYYNRVWYYTKQGTEEYKINWNQSTYPMVSSTGDAIEDNTGLDSVPNSHECWYSKDTTWHTLDCGGSLVRKNGDHVNCKNFYIFDDLKTIRDKNNRYWTVTYKDVSETGEDNYLSRKWEIDGGHKNVYYLNPTYNDGTNDTSITYIWDKSKPSSLQLWNRGAFENSHNFGDSAVMNTSTDATIGSDEGKANKNLIFDYAYNLTRSSSKDKRMLSGIGYADLNSGSPSVNGVENMLKLDFGVKPTSPLTVTSGGERNSDAYVANKKENITFNSAFVYNKGTSENDNSANNGNKPKDAAGLSYPTSLACYKCNGGSAGKNSKDAVEEVKDENGNVTTPAQDAVSGSDATACNGGHVSGTKNDDGSGTDHEPTWDHCPHCRGTHKGTSDDHVNWGNKICAVSNGGAVKQDNNPNSVDLLGFVNHFGSDSSGIIKREFEQIVYKYQTGSMPTGENTKLGQNSASKRATKRQGDIAEHNESYRMAFNYGSTANALKYFPEVKMGYYKNDGDTLSGASVTDTYNGRNLLDSNKTASDDGAAFNVAHSTLYTIGEKERSVKPSSLYLYRIGSKGGNSVNGSTASDSMLSSSHSNSLDKVTIPAGTDMTMKAKPENLRLNLYGYALDIIKKSDDGNLVGTSSSYTGYVKSDMDVYGDWGNNGNGYNPESEFNTWKSSMLKTSNYNADAILEVNGSRVYNNFTAAFGGFTGGSNTGGQVYVLKVEHGKLQNELGYPKLIEQIMKDYDCTQSEAKALFEASGIPQSIIDSLEHDTASQNKSDGKGNLDGFKVWNDFQLGSSAHWYDEMTRTFVVRRYAVENIGLKDVVLQDKLDLSDSANTNYGSRTNRSNNNRQYGNDKTVGAKWFVSIFFSPSSLTGSGDIKQNLLTLNPSPYKPANNSGTSLTQLIEGSNSYRESGVIVISNAPVHGADFLVPSSTTSNFGD